MRKRKILCYTALTRAMIVNPGWTSQVDGHLVPGLSMTRLHRTGRRDGRE